MEQWQRSLVCHLLLVVTVSNVGLAQTIATNNETFNLPWYIWLAIALAFSIVVILVGSSIICISYSCRRYYKNRTEVRSRFGPRNPLQVPQEIPLYMQANEWEVSRDRIKLVKQLAIGEYGPIFDTEVKLKTNITSRALVKVFQQGTSQDLVRFREDIDELMLFNHPNIGKLLGMVSHSPFYIVLELTVNGDLKSFLLATAAAGSSQRNGSNGRLKLGHTEVTAAQRVALATDVASGLAYLESLEYAHRDLATRNCMVTQHLGVKIADYKVGRYLFRSEYAVQADGSLMPLRWMAPESILKNVFTVVSSVWSFGVLLWEVMSQGSFPYPELSDSELITAVCYEGHRLPRLQDCSEQIYLLMERCWDPDPKQRPRPSVLHKTLESSILTNRYKHSEGTGETSLFY